ncbi:MAG: glycosyltransferase [Deltaproteobacteria bacterium]|nr:glycosyltransferase [Deltaproteobacteria bacterium]
MTTSRIYKAAPPDVFEQPARITVITPSYNQGRFIERTIKSVIGQGYPNLEYIVVDNGSTDETVSILKRYGGLLKWTSEKDAGQSDAINKGVRQATGEIVAYLNSDDVYEPGALARVADWFAANPAAKWLTGRCRIIGEDDREERGFITAYKNFLLDHYSYSILLMTNCISQPATFMRKEVFAEFGLFDVNQHRVMDYEFWLRVGARHDPGILKEYLASFRVYRASKTSSAFRKTFREELCAARRHSHSRVLNGAHYLNYIGICAAYSALSMISRRRG